MKKAFLLSLVVLGLAACADTRSHVNKDSTAWETVKYPTADEVQDQ